MFKRTLERSRKVIIRNREILRLIEPIVNLYRRGVVAFGPETATVTVAGLSSEFYTESLEEVRHFYPIFSDPDQLGDLLRELRPSDVLFDIGAHIGLYTCFVSQAHNSKSVIAFEPHPGNVSRLRENLELNGCNADIRPVALSDETGEIEISVDSDAPGAIAHLDPEVRTSSVKVNVVRGDDYLSKTETPTPDVLKIDVEGAELKVLRGLKQSLSECRVIYCEVSDLLQEYGDSEEELVEFLEEAGFEVEYLSGNDVIHGDLKAHR